MRSQGAGRRRLARRVQGIASLEIQKKRPHGAGAESTPAPVRPMALFADGLSSPGDVLDRDCDRGSAQGFNDVRMLGVKSADLVYDRRIGALRAVGQACDLLRGNLARYLRSYRSYAAFAACQVPQ